LSQRGHGHDMPCTKVKGRTETCSLTIHSLGWTDGWGEFPVIQTICSASMHIRMTFS
jgi:hypothetical protein